MKAAKKAISPKKAKSLAKERKSSQEEETENLEPWSRILVEAEKRHETQLNALIDEYEGDGDSENVARVKPRTLFSLFTEKS